MIIDVEGNLAGPLFFVLNELIVKIIKLRKFFVERHKLLIGQIALNLLMVCLIQEMTLLDEFGEFCQSPVFKRLVGRVLPEESTVTVMYELNHSAIHHLLMQDIPSQKSNLVAVELRHGFGSQFATNRFADSVHESLYKFIHARLGSMLKLGIVYLYFDHNLQNCNFQFAKIHEIVHKPKKKSKY